MTDVGVIDGDHATALIAINSNIDDIEDAFKYFTALAFNLNYFISFDKKLKRAAIPQLPVLSAKEFMEDWR